MLALTIIHAFGDRSVGETITDASEIQAALASHPNSVVRINLPDAEAAAPAKTAPAASPGGSPTAKPSAA